VKIGDLIMEALLDTEAEVNVITRALANHVNLPIWINIQLTLKTVSGKKRSFDEACEEVEVSIGNIKNVQTIMVVDSINHKLILGCPFFHDAQLTFLYDKDGYQNARFLTEDQTKEGEMRVCRPQSRQDREARALVEEESVNL
jgi:predicted aspartyl protease